MLSNEEEAQKRELAQGFLHFLIDGAAARVPAGRMPSLTEAIAERVARETRDQVDALLPQYLDQVLPRLVDQAVARRGGETQSALGRYGMIAVVACAVLAVTCLMLVALYLIRPAPSAAVDPNSPSVADEVVLPPGGASASVGG